ncbi:hypothetical protein GIB67_029074, partial [Kingdonia uniflora]
TKPSKEARKRLLKIVEAFSKCKRTQQHYLQDSTKLDPFYHYVLALHKVIKFISPFLIAQKNEKKEIDKEKELVCFSLCLTH